MFVLTFTLLGSDLIVSKHYSLIIGVDSTLKPFVQNYFVEKTKPNDETREIQKQKHKHKDKDKQKQKQKQKQEQNLMMKQGKSEMRRITNLELPLVNIPDGDPAVTR